MDDDKEEEEEEDDAAGGGGASGTAADKLLHIALRRAAFSIKAGMKTSSFPPAMVERERRE